MNVITQEIADAIATKVVAHYGTLSRFTKGYPRGQESTVLAAFVHVSAAGDIAVVSLATGTRCVGQWKASGDIPRSVRDCHAEVLARRALVVHVIGELKAGRAVPGEGWVLFISQPPCGDACVPSGTVAEDPAVASTTGAHAVRGAVIDPHGSPTDFVPNLVRTKPGRGVPCLSMSCSDKIAKWGVLGLHGALLSLCGARLRLAAVVVSRVHAPDAASLHRAVVGRVPLTTLTVFLSSAPCFAHCVLCHKPWLHCGVSMVWTPTILEAINSKHGALQGATRATAGQGSAISAVSPCRVLECAMGRISAALSVPESELRKLDASAVKALAVTYAASVAMFKRLPPFDQWVVKPSPYSHWTVRAAEGVE